VTARAPTTAAEVEATNADAFERALAKRKLSVIALDDIPADREESADESQAITNVVDSRA
jgi:hypothetical protein